MQYTFVLLLMIVRTGQLTQSREESRKKPKLNKIDGLFFVDINIEWSDCKSGSSLVIHVLNKKLPSNLS